MAILESVKELASKLGAETNGRDITDQLNKINKHLDSTGSRDIAEAVSKFADKEDGTAILITKTVTENKTYKASDDGASGYSSVTVNVPSAPVPETFEVNLLYDVDMTSLTTDKSYDEVKAAIQANKVIIFIWSIREQGGTVLSGTTSAVDYNSEGDFMSFVASFRYEAISGCYVFQWGNPETYTQASTTVQVLMNQIY